MNSVANPVALSASRKSGLRFVVQLLGSLKLAIPVLATVATVIAIATILEAERGRAYAQWYVYQSPWFVAVLALLGVNIFCAAAGRWPWKRHQTGFVITHCGLLILLTGSVLTFLGGIEGQVRLQEGQTTTKMILPQQSQITVSWTGRPEEAPYEFVFEPGPVDWRTSKTLNLGEVDGVSARVLHYYHHARVVEDWLPDAARVGGPAVRFKVQGPQRSETAEHMLVDQGFGDEIAFGPVQIQLQRAANAAMLADFLTPPGTKPGSKGTLVAYHNDQAKRIEVDEIIGKRIMLDGGIAVELVDYLPNAKPDVRGGFRSMGDSPVNPMLELAVHMPGANEPLRQVSFAKAPLLNLDPVYGKNSPITFRYYHPAVKPPTAIEFMQAEGGELHCRVCAESRVTPKGRVAAGCRIEMPGDYVFAIVEHRPHVRQVISFEPLTADPSQKDKEESAAAEVEITAGGTSRTVWLQRNHPTLGSQVLTTDEGPLQVRFSHGERKLDFSLKLLRFHREVNPGGVGNATYSSSVLLTDENRGIEREREIAMNKPLTHNGLTFYQSGFDDGGHSARSSTLSVGHDPGRVLKYGGSLLICLGIGIMFYMRAYFFKKVPDSQNRRWPWTRSESAVPSGTMEPAADMSPGRQDAGTLDVTSASLADHGVRQ